MKLVIDTLGSDLGSKEIKIAIRSFKKRNPKVEITAVGDENDLKELKGICNIIHAPKIVPMEAGPLEVMRLKDSSMYAAINEIKNGNGDAVISAGSTGGFLSAATINLKTIEGIKRAALVSPFPTIIKGKKVVILDIGANNANTPDELVQFAKMGVAYVNGVYNNHKPNVCLLSNGTEEGKGSPLIKETYKLLKDFDFFKGNIEARDVLRGEADVVVCDGFSGNILLKGIEGTAKVMSGFIKNIFKKNIWTKLGYLHVKDGINEMNETMDYKSTGGAMLLGINGVVVKAHGNSNAYAFECALNVAKSMIETNINESIRNGAK